MEGTLGRYEILGELGRGGMGVVYRARHTQLGKTVALKILPQDLGQLPTALARFVREARAAASLNHPHIIQVFDVDRVGDVHFFAMEFIEGETLKQKLRAHGPLPPGEAIHIARQIADALTYAHAHGIVHRDLKPANIMFDARGQVKVTDFGLAAAAGGESLTVTGEILGTPQYMSPEQVMGKDVDARSDLFSLGLIFCEMLSGHGPLDGLPLLSAMGKLIHRGEELELDLPAHLPASLRAIVARLARKEASQRYPSAADLLTDLTACEAEIRGEAPTVAAIRSVPSAEGERRPSAAGAPDLPRRRRLRLGLELASGGVVVAAVVLFLWRWEMRPSADALERRGGSPFAVGESTGQATPSETESPGPPSEKAERPQQIGGHPEGLLPSPATPLPGHGVPQTPSRKAAAPPNPPGTEPSSGQTQAGEAATAVPPNVQPSSEQIACEGARDEAIAAQAMVLAAELYGKAQQAEVAAFAAKTDGRSAEAAAGFTTAAGLYRRSRDAARSTASNLETARSGMEKARRGADGESAQNTSSYQAAQESEQMFGDSANDPVLALAAAARAESLYTVSILERGAQLARMEVADEQQKIKQARNPADRAALRRAEQYNADAESAFRSGDFVAAKRWFEKARDEYRLARARSDRR